MFYLSYFFRLTNIFRETELSHVCHISVDTAICHFRQMWTAPSHRHDRPQLLTAAITVTATAGTATAVSAATVVHNRSRSPLVRPAASHSTAAVSCRRPQLLCAVAAAPPLPSSTKKNRSPLVHPATSNSTAAVRCHRPQAVRRRRRQRRCH